MLENTNILDMNNRIRKLEEKPVPRELPDSPTEDGTYVLTCVEDDGVETLSWEAPSSGGLELKTQHLTGLRTDANGILSLDLNVDDIVLVAVTSKDFSTGFRFFEIGQYNSSGTYKYCVRVIDQTGAAQASGNYWIDVYYFEKQANNTRRKTK